MFTKDVPGSSQSTEGVTPDGQPQGAGSEIEGSEMFSLSALTALAAGAVRAPAPADRDESGLIDLNALLGETAAPAAADVVPDHISVSMFDIPAAPPSELPALAPDASTQRLARMWQTVAALCALGLVVAIAALASVPADRPSVAAAPVIAPAQPTPELRAAADPVTAPADPSLSELPPPARTEPVEVAVAPVKKSPRSTTPSKNRSETPVKKPAENSETPVKKPVEKKAPPADPCNGDLRCAMERALH